MNSGNKVISPGEDNETLILLLLCQELKCVKLFNVLTEVGFDHSFYRPDLSAIILKLLALDDNTDATFDFYYKHMQQHAARLKPNHKSVEREAQHLYQILKARKEGGYKTGQTNPQGNTL